MDLCPGHEEGKGKEAGNGLCVNGGEKTKKADFNPRREKEGEKEGGSRIISLLSQNLKK